MLLVLGLLAFCVGGAYATSAHLGLAKGHHHAKKHAKKKAKKHHSVRHSSATHSTSATQGSQSEGAAENEGADENESAAQKQYGTRPGKGCGDRNHDHTGPPGNPSNTSCPPQSKH